MYECGLDKDGTKHLKGIIAQQIRQASQSLIAIALYMLISANAVDAEYHIQQDEDDGVLGLERVSQATGGDIMASTGEVISQI
jgi:hypothetical protein